MKKARLILRIVLVAIFAMQATYCIATDIFARDIAEQSTTFDLIIIIIPFLIPLIYGIIGAVFVKKASRAFIALGLTLVIGAAFAQLMKVSTLIAYAVACLKFLVLSFFIIGENTERSRKKKKWNPNSVHDGPNDDGYDVNDMTGDEEMLDCEGSTDVSDM